MYICNIFIYKYRFTRYLLTIELIYSYNCLFVLEMAEKLKLVNICHINSNYA